MKEFLNSVNSAITKETAEQPIEGTNLSIAALEGIRDAIAHTAAKGESPRHCRAVDLIPDNFEWKRFDEWVGRFREKGEWPGGWENAADYYAFIDSGYPENDFKGYEWQDYISGLNKEALVAVAKEKKIPLAGCKTKKDIAARLEAAMPLPAIAEIHGMELADLKRGMQAEKAYLFQATLIAFGIEKRKIEEAEAEGFKRIKLYVADDACSFCRTLKKTYTLDEARVAINTLHPGCMCTFGAG